MAFHASELESESLSIPLRETHAVQFSSNGQATGPQPPEVEIDLNKTTFLSHVVRRWGKLPLNFLNGLDLRRYRYGFIGLDDWSMDPVLPPGSLVAIDDRRRKIATSGWSNELDRPIYFLEHRSGYLCGWCSVLDRRILVQPHPASRQEPRIFEVQSEVDVIGQVVGAAMRLDIRSERYESRSTNVPA